jgi:hypothetical protein
MYSLGEESARGSGDVPPEVNAETTNFQLRISFEP